MAQEKRQLTAPDPDGVRYPLRRVRECTCSGGPRHESNCGWEIDDSRELRS
jgi:hypothetical protein